jgi:hypothetical protein
MVEKRFETPDEVRTFEKEKIRSHKNRRNGA